MTSMQKSRNIETFSNKPELSLKARILNMLPVGFVSLECVTAAASNEYTVLRGKRAFPAAPNLICTYNREAMRDLVAILKVVAETNSFSATERARIFQTFTSKYSSVDECDSLIRSVMANCVGIIDFRKNGKTEELEAKLKNLQINLDSVDRRAMQREATLRQSFNNIEDALKLELRQSELKRHQAEKNHAQAVIQLVTQHLQTGDVDVAVNNFSALTNRDALAGELVQKAHSNSKVQLLHLAQFASKLNFFTTAYFTMNSLYKEMQKSGQLEEKETILLYYRLKHLVVDANFALQALNVKNNYHELIEQLSPHLDKIMKSLISDIKQNEFIRSGQVVEMARTTANGERFFVSDLLQSYLQSTSLDQFPQLYKFVETLKYFNTICDAFNLIWKELKKTGKIGYLEALAVWSYASEVTITKEFSNAPCKEIADETAPAYYDTLKNYYKYYIQHGDLEEIRNLHKKYNLRYCFTGYIKTLSITELQDDNFNKIYNAIDNLPYFQDACFAASAVYERFKTTDMIGTYEHFLTLKVAKRMLSHGIVDDELTKSKCESVAENTPYVFRKLLYDDTSNCRLINRHGGALYCTSWFHEYTDGYRPIYVWKDNYPTDDDQFWKLEITSDGLIMLNNYHSDYNLRYLENTVQGSPGSYEKNYDYFRVHDKDSYLILEPTTAKVYVGASKLKGDESRRDVEMISDSFNQRTHWILEC